MSAVSDSYESGRSAIAGECTVRTLLLQLSSRLAMSDVLAAAQENNGLDREAREIVATLLGVSPGEVSRRVDENVDEVVATRALNITMRRAKGEPLAYCLGSAPFRHLELLVDNRVLIPRPETEVVVDQALRLMANRRGGIAVDIGTGSGAIALSLATEGRFERVVATDVSPDALAVARLNADRVLNADALATVSTREWAPAHVEFRLGRDFEPLGGIRAQVVVSNPPYIAPDEAAELPLSVRVWEPALALFADDGGMARYDVLLAGAPSYLVTGGWLVLEVDSRRAIETARRATACGLYDAVQLVRDLTNRDRVLLARVRGDISSE